MIPQAAGHTLKYTPESQLYPQLDSHSPVTFQSIQIKAIIPNTMPILCYTIILASEVLESALLNGVWEKWHL